MADLNGTKTGPEKKQDKKDVIIRIRGLVTGFGTMKPGDPVNIEIDTLARYVARLAETA